MTLSMQAFTVGVVFTILSGAGLATAADPKLELGTTLAGATIGLGSNDVTALGIPSGSLFGFGGGGIYGSIFCGSRFAVEPQFSLLVLSGGGSTEHTLGLAGQVDYFIMGASTPSAFVFASAGILDVSGGGPTPKSVSGGAGYRIPVGDRLAVRFDGRILHYTDGGGNALVLNLSFGGTFGQR